MIFAVLDHDSLITALQSVWDQIAPPAMFTAAGNISIRNSENFIEMINMIKWNKTVSEAAQLNYNLSGQGNAGYGYIGEGAITPNKQEGSNGGPTQYDAEHGYFVEDWGQGDDVYVPAGFAPMKAENICYSDELPPSIILIFVA